MLRLDIDTTDPEFRTALDAAQIDGLTYTFRMDAAADTTLVDHVVWLTVNFVTSTVASLFATWLYDYIIHRKSHQITINQINVTENPGQVHVIIHNHIQRNQGDIPDQEQP